MNQTKLVVIIPCYNEEKVLPLTAPMFLEALQGMIDKGKISDESRILFVNDGSRDDTWAIIKVLAAQEAHFLGIAQSRNRGHQNALLAGLMEEKGYADITITADCDGQDDISVMEEMVDAYHNGADVVYGVRKSRDKDSFFKKWTAEAFYKLIRKMGADVVFNHADYRLISARVLEALAGYKEVNVFLRGLVPLVGFSSANVYYDRHERLAGESRYPLSKMLNFAFDGITSLTIKPLRMITGLGLGIAAISFLGVIWAIVMAILGRTISGWASMTCIICFVSGVQLICLGVMGEYIGKIYMETKQRPRYVISERTFAETPGESDATDK
ncbi:MAG: glycosyltransferase family 2 protein [Lachnospiraceae bacterium]|nr:glycosyltransferase family 2 protein [Lachnospiraceae bacterium]